MNFCLRTVSAAILLGFLTSEAIIFSFSSATSGIHYCHENERKALFMFMQEVIDPSNRLTSWSDGKNCCNWAGVRCHNLTGHATGLLLRNPHTDFRNLAEYWRYDRSKLYGKISDSLLSLKYLAYLDLSGNDFGGLQIPKFLGSMKSLRYLSLSGAGFQGLIPHQLGNLSNLRYLNLGHERKYSLYVDQNLQWISGLSSLEHLDMSFVDFSKASDWLQVMSSFPYLTELYLSGCDLYPVSVLPRENFSSLAVLDLSHNHFPLWVFGLNSLISLDLSSCNLQGQIPDGLRNMNSLRYLDLSDNHFNSSLPSWLFRFQNLRSLVLRNNSFHGSIPDAIGNITSTSHLDLSKNYLAGTVPESLGQLTKLKFLYLGHNFLEGNVSEVLFAHLKRLKVFSASHNPLTLTVRPNWTPPFQLEHLSLSGWHLGPAFPQWIHSQRFLSVLDISLAGISDTIPCWFWNLSSQFSKLNISHNQFYGRIPDLLNVVPIHSDLAAFDLSFNNFKGPLPRLSSQIGVLDLSTNSFSGSLSHFLCHSTGEPKRLEFLHLGNNGLSGEIPNCWKNWPCLIYLQMQNNNLTGKIPSSIGSLSKLRSLHIPNNRLSGAIPSLERCSELSVIDLCENKLEGKIPGWIGNLSRAMIIILRANNIQGHIPDGLCALTGLKILDLAYNNLSGNIPHCFLNFSAMAENSSSSQYRVPRVVSDFSDLFLEKAMLMIKGIVLEYSTTLFLVTIMDLSNNNLQGKIPEELTRLSGLYSVNLSENLLTGHIPDNIGNMRSLESLDISLNKLSGEIPESMSNMNFLCALNLSYNNLTGKIPSGTQIQSFNASSFVGNNLCGAPLWEKCSRNDIPPTPRRTPSDRKGHEQVNWFYVGLSISIMVGFWAVVGPLLYKREWRVAYFRWVDRLGNQFWWYVIHRYFSS